MKTPTATANPAATCTPDGNRMKPFHRRLRARRPGKRRAAPRSARRKSRHAPDARRTAIPPTASPPPSGRADTPLRLRARARPRGFARRGEARRFAVLEIERGTARARTRSTPRIVVEFGTRVQALPRGRMAMAKRPCSGTRLDACRRGDVDRPVQELLPPCSILAYFRGAPLDAPTCLAARGRGLLLERAELRVRTADERIERGSRALRDVVEPARGPVEPNVEQGPLRVGGAPPLRVEVLDFRLARGRFGEQTHLAVLGLPFPEDDAVKRRHTLVERRDAILGDVGND